MVFTPENDWVKEPHLPPPVLLVRIPGSRFQASAWPWRAKGAFTRNADGMTDTHIGRQVPAEVEIFCSRTVRDR